MDAPPVINDELGWMDDLYNQLNSVLDELKWDAELASTISLRNYPIIHPILLHYFLAKWKDMMSYKFEDATLDAQYYPDLYDNERVVIVSIKYLE